MINLRYLIANNAALAVKFTRKFHLEVSGNHEHHGIVEPKICDSEPLLYIQIQL